METIKFEGWETSFPIESIQPVATHVLRIIYADVMPNDNGYQRSITIYTQGGIESATLYGWNTIYYKDTANKTVYLSDDGSVYTEPEEQPKTSEPTPSEPEEPYEPTVEELQSSKISAMNAASQNAIHNGTDVTLSDGTTEHFSLTTDDQIALLIRSIQIDHGADEVDYHADGEGSKYYSADDMQEIITTAEDFIDYHTTYCNELCLWIGTLTDKDEIDAVYYGMEIPVNHRSEVLEKMLPVADDETGMLPEEGKNDDDNTEGGEPEDDDDDTNIGAGGEIDVGDPADSYEPGDEPEPADDGDGDD